MKKRVILGSILKVGEDLGMVVGFQNVKFKEKMKVCCQVVPYPYGYIDDEYMKHIQWKRLLFWKRVMPVDLQTLLRIT